MKQLQQSVRGGDVRVVDVPTPRAGRAQVLVQVAASLISAGTERMVMEFAGKTMIDKARARPDLVREVLDKARREGYLTTFEAVRNRLGQPLALGYSCAGTVIDVGRDVTGLQRGDRVACGGSYAAHAEVVAVPVNLVARIPEPRHADGPALLEEAAFTTIGAIALQSLRLADVKLGEVVAVIGLGLLGQLTVQMLRAAGCIVVGMDIQPARADLARQLGADEVASDADTFAAAVQRLSNGHGADAVLIAADTPSNDPIELAGRIARDRGVVVAIGAVGMNIPRKVYYEKELDFRVSRSYGPGRYDPGYEEDGHDYPVGYVRWTENRNMQAFVQLVAERKVDVRPLISHRFPMEQAPEAYDLILGKAGQPFLGVLIVHSETELRSDPNAGATLELVGGPARPMSERTGNATVAVGLLGAGNFASNTLLPAMKKVPGIEFAVVGTASGLSARTAADHFGFRACTTDERAVIEDARVNTVAIATRHNHHARQVLAALAAGKHVFCEKPLALDEGELGLIVAAYEAQSRGVVLTVGFNRRFAPMAQQLKRFFAGVREPLAMHYRINAGYIAPDHWVHDREQGGGRIIGEVCHFVDLLTFLAGSLPTRVQARVLPNVGRFSDDNLVATFDFANGSLGTITYLANGDKTFPKERLEVFGGGRVAVLDDFRRLELVRNGRRAIASSRLRQDKGHRGEWETMVAAVSQGGSALPIPFEELVATSLATFRIEDSQRSGEAADVDTARFLASTRG